MNARQCPRVRTSVDFLTRLHGLDVGHRLDNDHGSPGRASKGEQEYLFIFRPLHFQIVVMVFTPLSGEPLQLIRTDEYDSYEYRCVLERCQCMRDAGCQIDKVPGMQDLVPFIHLEIDLTFDALHRDRAINCVHRHPFASRKNNRKR